jgi:hypothetical protein
MSYFMDLSIHVFENTSLPSVVFLCTVFLGTTSALMRTTLNNAGVFLDTTGAFMRTPLYHEGVFIGTTSV